MTRIPSLCRIFVVSALLALIAVPMVGARPVDVPAASPAGDGWLGAALRWAEGLVALYPGHRHSAKGPVTEKDTLMQPNGGSCIDPTGHPKPACL
ncbi:MAG TPA: hypothetical protein VGH73_13845 [Thermoanaerobaculia bacterium]